MQMQPLHDLIPKPTGRIVIDLREGYTKSGRKAYGRGRLKERIVIPNMFVTLGKNSIARGLQGDTTSGEITYCAVGTSGVAPALGDTGLTAELSRKLVSVRSFSGNQAIFQTYFGTADANGTLLEAALFGDTGTNGASATPGSGTLYAKAAINRTKTINDTLTITWTITIG